MLAARRSGKDSFDQRDISTNFESCAFALNYHDREKIYLPRRLILLRATNMKCAAVSVLVSIAFVSPAFAVLRPLFPAKPAPPFNGELINVGGDSIRHPPAETPATASK